MPGVATRAIHNSMRLEQLQKYNAARAFDRPTRTIIANETFEYFRMIVSELRDKIARLRLAHGKASVLDTTNDDIPNGVYRELRDTRQPMPR